MYYNQMLLSNHQVIFPAYMDKSARMQLKERMQREHLDMYCGCSIFTQNKLMYNISADARFVPMHQNYEHSPLCSRDGRSAKRKVSYQVDDEGNAKAYLKFDIRSFSVPAIKVEEDASKEEDKEEIKEDNSSASEDAENDMEKPEKKEAAKDKEPFDTLSQFILQLNTDTYRERVTAGKGMLSADYFLPAVLSRLKKVYISGIRKPLKELSLEEDGLSFFYQPLLNVEDQERCFITLKGWKRDYTQFLFKGTLKKELALFEKRYGLPLHKALEKYTIMAAGFTYLCQTKQFKVYRAVGRVHFFIVNNNGLYCSNIDEVEELNLIERLIRKNYKNTSFHRVIDDPRIFGIIAKAGKKQILLCKPKIPKSIDVEGPEHIAYGTELISEQDIMVLEEMLKS